MSVVRWSFKWSTNHNYTNYSRQKELPNETDHRKLQWCCRRQKYEPTKPLLVLFTLNDTFKVCDHWSNIVLKTKSPCASLKRLGCWLFRRSHWLNKNNQSCDRVSGIMFAYVPILRFVCERNKITSFLANSLFSQRKTKTRWTEVATWRLALSEM